MPGKDNPAPHFMSRCKQNKQAGLALIYSDQKCWDVESPIIASVKQARNCDMIYRAVTFGRVERALELFRLKTVQTSIERIFLKITLVKTLLTGGPFQLFYCCM